MNKLLIMGGLSLACFQSNFMTAQAADTKPNIILILADDLGYGDIGPFGSVKNRTPNLDRMAAEGLKLASFYAAPVCTPSRAQIMTGCYAKRVSLPRVLGPVASIGISSEEHSLAKLLKKQGYATMAVGKWHLGDQPEFLPTKHGFDGYFGLPYSNDMGANFISRNQKQNPKGKAPTKSPPLPLVRDNQAIEVVTAEAQDHLTERYTDAAIKFIRENASQPFFLYLPHTAVHKPIHPGRKFLGKSANGKYGDWVEELDWSVGRVIDTVCELGMSERTLIVFTSDNGPYLVDPEIGGVAGPLRGGKGGTFEGGVREPTVAWWPGKIPAGATSDAMTGNIDLLPTFVKLSGGTIPADKKIDGVDICPILFGKAKESTRKAHYYFVQESLQAVRSGPWKMAIAKQNECNGKPFTDDPNFIPHLYNLDTDIGERNDVAASHPHIVRQLQSLVAEMDKDLGVKKNGPGVRLSGRVENPVGLWVPGQKPSDEVIREHYD